VKTHPLGNIQIENIPDEWNLNVSSLRNGDIISSQASPAIFVLEIIF